MKYSNISRYKMDFLPIVEQILNDYEELYEFDNFEFETFSFEAKGEKYIGMEV